MQDVLGALGAFLLAVLPEWVRLPSLTFTMPHWAYWAGLIGFPLIAMFLVHRAEQTRTSHLASLPTAYLLWFWSGFAGLHRFYVGSLKFGLVFVALFLVILYGNSHGTIARDAKSATDNELKIADFMVKRAEKDLARGRSGAEKKLAAAKKKLGQVEIKAEKAAAEHEKWRALVGGAFGLILILMLVDFFLLPRLVRAAQIKDAQKPEPREFDVMERGARGDERTAITSPFIRTIDKISDWSGNFVAYWSVLAVFVYYYEVIARYVFNSPTNWAHESMFLMFGMQYLLSGAYALKEDAHVRVDVIYGMFSTRVRTMIDVVTSMFFFIFTATLLVTGFLFARDSIDVWEVSFTEWAIQYWPVKITIGLGAALLLLQGIARLIRDVTYLRQGAES